MLDRQAEAAVAVEDHGGTDGVGGLCAPCGSRWAVVFTHSQAERWAVQNLQRQGYPAYVPLVTIRRRDRVLRSLWHDVEVPLFPRYAFVVAGSHWSPIRGTAGVAQLLVDAAGKPYLLRAGLVEALQEGESLRRYPPSGPPALWAPGMACRASVGGVELRGAVTRVVKRVAYVAAVMFGEVREIVIDLSALRA